MYSLVVNFSRTDDQRNTTLDVGKKQRSYCVHFFHGVIETNGVKFHIRCDEMRSQRYVDFTRKSSL